MEQFPVFCGRDCGGNACPLLASVDNGRVTRVIPNPAGGRFISGCPRGLNLPHWQYAPDRLLTPLVRTGPRGSGQFRQATWEEALEITAGRLGEIRARYGPQAVMQMSSAGDTGALHGTDPLAARFFHFFGGSTFPRTNYSNGAACFSLPYVLGKDWNGSGWDAATMQYSRMIILWGANVLETRMGSEAPRRLLEARRRGAEIVAIDPRRTATVKSAATWWLPCRPGTDAALMLAVLYTWITESLVDRAFITTHSVGFEALERYVLGEDGGDVHSASWAEPICGLPSAEIIRFARAYAAAKPAMLFPGYSIQRVFAGEETYRLAVALQVASGNFGLRGGSTGSLNNRLPTPRVGKLPVPPTPDQVTVSGLRWPDAILEGKRGGYPTDVHAIYNLGSNFINQGADARKSMAAFSRAEFSVCHDFFLTPTARWCDVVLPAAGPLEKEDIGIPWLGNYLLYRPQVVPPSGQARSDYDVLCDLADRLGFGASFSEGHDAAAWIQHFLDDSEVADQEDFRRTGIYLAPDQERVGLSAFSADPAAYPLRTPSGLVELSSERYERETGSPAVPAWQASPEEERYPLRLITPKSAYRIHSQGSNVTALRVKEPHALEMHPHDAAERGITDGSLVRVVNDQGEVQIRVRLSDDLAPGVVCLQEGIWLELDMNMVEVAGSANMLTSTDGTRVSQAPVMHAIAVQVTRV